MSASHPSDAEGRTPSDCGHPWFGCFTGDCPHETQAGCDAAIRDEFAKLEHLVDCASRSSAPTNNPTANQQATEEPRATSDLPTRGAASAKDGVSPSVEPPAAPSEGPTPETCWLIERGQPEHHVPTVWWLGGLDWTETASEAAKFASRVAAEAEIRARSSYVGDPFGRATEHVFLSDSNAIEMPLLPVPLPVPAQEAEALVDGVVAWALACHCIGGTHVPYCQLPQRRADLLARLRSPSEIPEADDDRTVEQWHDDAMKYADRLLDAENQNLPDVARMFALLAFNCELAALRRASELKSSLATRAILLKSLTCLAADAFTPDRASRASRASRSPEETPDAAPQHRCGVRGFDSWKGDVCPACTPSDSSRSNTEK